jgi:endonuclease YncB( thermonuclease family)
MEGFLFLIAMAVRSTATFGLEGQVVTIVDGDTIELLDPYIHLHKIRLYCIDAPEKSMPYGQRSKQKLAELVYAKDLHVIVYDVDRYGREIGDLIVDGQSVNLEMVRTGFAWEYPKYCRDPAYWAAQNKAAVARAGLWADRAPVPPWEYRKSVR